MAKRFLCRVHGWYTRRRRIHPKPRPISEEVLSSMGLQLSAEKFCNCRHVKRLASCLDLHRQHASCCFEFPKDDDALAPAILSLKGDSVTRPAASLNANQHTSDSETNEAISRNTKEEFVAEHWRRLGGYRAGEQNPHPSVKVHAAGGHCLPAHILLLSHESNRATAGQLIQAAPPKGKSGFCPSTPMRLCLHCWKECLPKHRCTCGQGRCKYQYFAGFGLLPQKNVIFEFVAFTLFDAFLSKHWNSMFSESWPQKPL